METGTRTVYLETAGAAVRLLRDPAVAAAWERPSALAKLSVGGLAGHLREFAAAGAVSLDGLEQIYG